MRNDATIPVLIRKDSPTDANRESNATYAEKTMTNKSLKTSSERYLRRQERSVGISCLITSVFKISLPQGHLNITGLSEKMSPTRIASAPTCSRCLKTGPLRPCANSALNSALHVFTLRFSVDLFGGPFSHCEPYD
jgi:hypothetical protein